MPEFDVNAYFAQKAAGLSSKVEQLAAASQNKVFQLEATSERARQSLAADAADTSWANRLGLDPTDLVGGAVNLGASVVSGASRLAGHTLSLPVSVLGSDSSYNTEKDVVAYNRVKTGVATAEDLAQLNRVQPNGQTPLEAFQATEKSRATARGINNFFDLTGIVQQDARQAFGKELEQGFQPEWDKITNGSAAEKVSGLAGLLANTAGALLNNKQAVLEYIGENAPQLFVGALGKAGQVAMGGSNVGYAVDTYQQGIENYAKANDGQLPPEEQRQRMAVQAASLALAEQVGDVAGLAAMKLVKPSADAARAGFIQSLKNVGKASGQGFVTEALTEGYQQYTEGEILGKPATAAEIYSAAVIGGASGGGLSAGGRALAEATGATPEQAAVRQVVQEKAKSRIETQKAAIATGDVTALLDTKNAAYSPSNAITALAGHSALETTTPEQKQANLAKASQVIDALTKERDTVQEANDLNSPDAVKGWQEQLVRAKAKGNASEVAMLEEALADVNPAETKRNEARLAKLDERLSEAHAAMADFNTELHASVDVAAQVATINAPLEATDTVAVAARTKAADTLLTLSMAVPERLSVKDAQALEANADNGLSDNQRAYLRAFSAARIAENKAKNIEKVRQDIFVGRKGFIGLDQYRSRMSVALTIEAKSAADGLLLMLRNFATNQQGKAVAVKEAWDQGKGTYALRTKAGEWFVADTLPEGWEDHRTNGGLRVNTPKLIDATEDEAAAVSAALAELTAAYDLKFSKTTQGGQSNVTNVSQAPAATQDSAPANQEVSAAASDAAPVDAGSVAATGGTAVASGTTAVEGTGVADPFISAWLAQIGSRGEYDNYVEGRDSTVVPGSDEDRAGFRAWVREHTYKKKPVAAPTDEQVSIPAAVKAMSDEELNAALEVEMGKPGYQKNIRFKRLDAEMTLRETAASNQNTEVPDLTESAEQTSSQAETSVATTEESISEAESKDGTLEVMNRLTPEGTLYTLRELLAENFTQAASRKGDTSSRALVAVKDLYTALENKVVDLKDFVGDLVLSKVHRDAVAAFLAHADKWEEVIRWNLPKRANPDFKHKNMLQYFLIQNPSDPDNAAAVDLEQNVKLAISYAVYGWVAENATKPWQNKDGTINSLLGREKGKRVLPAARKWLGAAGNYQHIIADSLGRNVFDALGLVANKDAPQDLEPRMIAALGEHALRLAENMGLVTRTEVPGPVMVALRAGKQVPALLSQDELKNLSSAAQRPHREVYTFFTIARDKQVTPEGRTIRPMVKAVREIHEATRGTQGVLDKLFGTTAGRTLPSLKPIQNVQKTTSGTKQSVPDEMARVIKLDQARQWKVRQDLLMLFDGFSEEQLQAMMGVVEVTEKNTHLVNRPGVEAKNDGLKREWELFREYVGEYLAMAPGKLSTPFYLPYNVWKQQRVGIDSSVVNPQTSKIVRRLIAMPEWTAEIDPRSDKYDEQINSFWLRVAEGLGIKTERKDNVLSIDEIMATVRLPIYADAIKALVKNVVGVRNDEGGLAKQDLTEDEKASIVAAVGKGKENLHTLDALLSVAYHDAADGAAFSVQLLGGVDGVANGTMFNHVLLGVNDPGLMNQGGFFEEGNAHTQYNQWRGDKTANNLDVYESTMRRVYEWIRSQYGDVAASNSSKINSIWALAGEAFTDGQATSDGRKLIKDALNPLGFGSSLKNIIEGMSDTFVEAVYTRFTKLSVSDATQEEVDTYVRHINNLIKDKKYHLALGDSIQTHMERALHPRTEALLMESFATTVGASTADIVKLDFAEFIEKRDSLNGTVNATWGISDAIYRGLRQDYIAELHAKGEMPADKYGNVVGDLSKEQEKALKERFRPVLAIIATATSMGDNHTDGGLLIGKTKRKQSDDPVYANETKFGRGGNVNSQGMATVGEAPGVAIGSATTHSSDSAAMIRTKEELAILGVHDEAGAGVGGLKDTAIAINKNTFDTLLNYSPLNEAYVALGNVLGGIAGMLKDGSMTPSAVGYLQEFLQVEASKRETPVETLLVELLNNAKQYAYEADTSKLGMMRNWVSVDQYAYQGGNYPVTEANRLEATRLLEAATSVLSKADEAALAELVGVMDINPEDMGAPVTEAPATVETTDVAEDSGEEFFVPDDKDTLDYPPWEDGKTTTAAKESFFGEVGKPPRIDKRLAALFKDKPSITAVEAIAGLRKMMQDSAGNVGIGYHSILLDLLLSAMPKGVTVSLVTPKMGKEDVVDYPKKKDGTFAPAFGWNTGKNIYVLSEEFVNSGLQTPELLLHELVHAALVQATEYPSKAAKLLVDNLKALMAQVASVATAEEKVTYGAAFSDVHEFIAYGMTRTSLQRLMASVTVNETPGSKTSTLINGFKRFIATLTDLLFVRLDYVGMAKKDQANTALYALIKNVTGLMKQAEKDSAAGIASTSQSEITKAMSSPMAGVQSYTTLDIHNALNSGNLSAVWDTHLQGLLSGIVRTLHGPFGAFKAALMKDQAITPMDVWMKALNTGVAPFASKLKAAPILISEREMHAMEQVEAVMREALSRNETSAKTAYKELGKLFMEMREAIKPSDFGNQDDYDFIFKISLDPQERSDHLARFAAFGLAHQEFNNLMKRATELNTKKVASGKSFAERFQILFEKVLSFFHEKVTNTYAGEQADKKLTKLVEQLVDIEARKKAAIAKKSFDVVGILENNLKDVAEKGRTAITDLVNKPIVKDNANAFVRAAGGIARTVANNQVEWVLKSIGQIRDTELKGRHGFAMQMLNEVKGPGQVINSLVLAATSQQRHRKQVIDQTAKFSLQAFANKGKGFTKAAKAAVTQVFMRTGMHVLLDEYNMQELEQLVGNPQALSAAILATEKKLNGFPLYKEHFINQANALAAYRVTGRVHAKTMTMNAYAIARMYGFHAQSRFTEQQAQQVQPEIEKLIALYAIGYVDGKVLNEAKSTLHSENQRSDGNGVEFVLRMHKELDSQAHAKLFRGQEALMMHGYVPEIYNPNTSVTVANQTEGETLKLMGYEQSGEVSKDRADPDREAKHLYVQRDGGLAPWVSGAMSTTGMHTKGSTKHSGFLNVNTADGLENASMQADIINAKSMSLNTGPRRDLSKEGQQTYMAPVLNPQGEIVNWRYMMQDKTKDVILERENDFTKVMGMLAGSIYDKESSKETNYKVLGALYAMDKAERKIDPESYILVGPGSKDAQLQEVWNLLPKKTREQAKAIWGKDGMWVRKDALTTIFGYRKFSLAESFRKDPDARNQVEKLFVGIMEFLLVTHYRVNNPGKPQQEAEDFAKRAAVYVTRGERGWQELVRATKDIIVVKSGIVMMGNVWSNIWLLKLSGVPLATLVKTHLVALRGVRSYQADNEELARLQALVDTGLTGTKATQIEQEIVHLKDALTRNPVAELIDAGLMPTISEEVEGDDPYSYKSSVVKATELITDKIHPALVDVGKTLLVTHDTKLYQGLARITQLSDFVARYTLYEHLTNRKENPLSKEDAVFEASESFINYDIPMPKGMQYMDDMGITMFTKYFLRIQRVLGRMARDNPGQVLMTLALDNFLDLGPIVLESSWLHKVGNNPLNWGALQLPGSVGELGTVAGAMALVK